MILPFNLSHRIQGKEAGMREAMRWIKTVTKGLYVPWICITSYMLDIYGNVYVCELVFKAQLISY